MPNYLLTIKISLTNKLDDIAAKQAASLIIDTYNIEGIEPDEAVIVKLQELIENKPPRKVSL